MIFDSTILLPEITFKTSRSGGPGGQNVNKVSSKVLLEFSVAQSEFLNKNQKDIIQHKLRSKINADGMLQVMCQAERSQLANKQKALQKFYKLIAQCFIVPKKRKPTKVPTQVKQERLKNKKHKAQIKSLRSGKL
jgi:ribosome-associated protein